MKHFIAYRMTGDDPVAVRERVGALKEALREAGHEVYENASKSDEFHQRGMTPRQIMDDGFSELDECDALFVLIAGPERSEGMLMEVGYAYAKGMPITVAVKHGVDTYVDTMGDTVIRWSEPADLYSQIAAVRP